MDKLKELPAKQPINKVSTSVEKNVAELGDLNTVWMRKGPALVPTEGSVIIQNIPSGVYTVEETLQGLVLNSLFNAFQFPTKIYGLTDGFVDRVIKTYHVKDENLGILLDGVKGTGKTLTAQVICQRLGLPVIIHSKMLNGLVPFLARITQPVIHFFDEFEKSFDHEFGEPSQLLTIMDGVMSNGAFKNVFLLTTNALTIEKSLLQRPGRIRYLRTFGNLNEAVIREIVNDRLLPECEHLKEKLIRTISELETITVDVVCALVDETNIHQDDIDHWLHIFNVKKYSDYSDLFEIIEEEGKPIIEKQVRTKVRINPRTLSPHMSKSGYELTVSGEDIGIIQEVEGDDTVLVQLYGKTGKLTKETKKFCIKPNYSVNYSWNKSCTYTL